MKLAAIYNVWDGVELLRGSMECLRNEVDLFITIYQNTSNYGERYKPFEDVADGTNFAEKYLPYETGCFSSIQIRYEPNLLAGGRINEISKREFGLEFAKLEGCTHFLMLDCDEYYSDFAKAKQAYIDSGASGSCCKIYTYFKKPTLRFEKEDNYYVPFIHELKPDTTAGVKNYPFYVDPTRRINNENVVLLDVHMHHYSWVRKDIERKIRNSSARNNINRGNLLADYNSPDIGPGFIVRDYNQKLIEVPNYFNIEV